MISAHRGTTLLELLVALAILALMLGLGAIAVTSLRPAPGAAGLDSLRAARDRALRTGEPVTVTVRGRVVRLLPDGRVLGGLLDPLTGRPLNAN